MKILIFILCLLPLASAHTDEIEKRFLDPNNHCAKYTLPKGKGNPHKLSLAERMAIYTYTYANFQAINNGLYKNAKRNGTGAVAELSECNKMQVDLMDRALKKIPSYTGKTVYRGTESKHFPQGQNEFTLHGYSSTSKTRAVAETFVRDALIIIHGVKNGKPLRPYSSEEGDGMSMDEEEILLPRGTKIQIFRRHQEKIIVKSMHDEDREVLTWVLEANAVD